MKRFQHHIISRLLIVIYLLAVFSPVAPLVMHSTARECSGNCSTDGCSLERSAAHTCCCWRKKQRMSNSSQQQDNADCCATKRSKTMPPPTPRVSCCAPRNGNTSKERIESASTSSTDSQQQRTTSISTGTCGNNKLFTTGAPDNTQHLPCFFAAVTPAPRQSTLTFIPPNRLASQHGPPPDPPPKLA